MAEKRDILWRFLGDAKDLNRATRDAQRDLKDTNRAVGTVNTGMGNMTKAIAGVGLAIGAAEIGQFALDAVEMATKAEEAARSLEDVLGPAAVDLRADLEDARYTMGLNVGEFDSMAAQLSLLISGMGLSAEETAGIVGNLIERGGDLAAFRGDVSESTAAVEAITGAMRGEFDALEQFGVKLSAAKVEAEKLRLEGLDPMFATLSEEQQTIEAIVSLIDQGAEPAIGRLGDAAETTAGKTNEMTTKLEDLQIELGEKLQGPMEGAIEGVLDFIEALEGLNELNFEPALGIIGGLFLRVIDGAGAGRRAIESLQRAFDALNRTDVRRIGGKENPELRFPGGRPPILPGAGGLSPGGVGGWGGYQSGGVVPGIGPQAAILHGGERVVPRGQAGMAEGSIVVNFNGVVGDPDAVASQIADLIRRYQQTNGELQSGIGL